jgi:AraC-like DNA-binding protein
MKYKDELVIEVDEIKKMMDLCSNLFNIRTSFIYAIDNEQYTNEIAGNNGDYQNYCMLVQEELKHKCIACDRDKFKEANSIRKPLLYQCYSGLFEMYLPLFIENYLIGYLHFGQVRVEKDFSIIADKYLLHEHSKLAELEKSYNSMEVFDMGKLVLISELLEHFANTILKNKLIEFKKSTTEFNLKKYVEENLNKPINVKEAAEFIKMSTSFVTHKFKELYGQTFHVYLTNARIEHSKELLKRHSISETSQMCGFHNRYHFSKVFKKIEGITPHEFQLNLEK